MKEKTKRSLENKRAQMRKGVLEFCTLLVLSNKRMYASEIIASLDKVDLQIGEGTLYPLLARLKNDGFLTYEWEESKSGPPRKYYKLTKDGENNLTQMKKMWKCVNKAINSLI